jgi:hypothetical protein
MNKTFAYLKTFNYLNLFFQIWNLSLMVIPLTKDGSLGIVQPKPESLQTREIINKKIVLIVRHLFAN